MQCLASAYRPSVAPVWTRTPAPVLDTMLLGDSIGMIKYKTLRWACDVFVGRNIKGDITILYSQPKHMFYAELSYTQGPGFL